MTQIAKVYSVKQFIAVDDDLASLFMCKVLTQRTFKDIPVVTYSNPQLAADYFQTEFSLNPVETVIFLDINMPEISGWDVLATLHLLKPNIQEKINVIMLSSSIDLKDKQHAIEFPLVTAFIEKPLSMARLEEEMEKIQAEMIRN